MFLHSVFPPTPINPIQSLGKTFGRTKMTDTLSPHYRNLSNKENSGLTYPRRPHPGPRSIAASTHSSSASSKPRVSGIGRAPRQARKHSVHKPYRKPSTALPKLQVRSSSVQRAKAKANEELSSRIVMRGRRHGAVPPDLRLDKMSMGETIIEEGDVDMEVDSGSKPTYRLRLVSVPAPRHPSLPRNKHEMANQLSTIRMPSTSASTLHNETQPMTGPNLPRILGRVPTRMPPRLRKPMIPPVIADSTGECVVVSALLLTCPTLADLIYSPLIMLSTESTLTSRRSMISSLVSQNATTRYASHPLDSTLPSTAHPSAQLIGSMTCMTSFHIGSRAASRMED